jgi:predicted PurR-regulated permease PerM
VLALVLFGLFLGYHFLSGIVTATLMLLVGFLLAVALSGPVEALHRRKVPRPIASISIFLGILVLVMAGGYLFFPVLVEQVSQLVLALPTTLAQLGEFFERSANTLGLPVVSGEAPSLSTLVGWGRQLLGGVLGLFGDLASLVFGLVVVLFLPLYLAASPEPAVSWALRFFPPASRPRVQEVLSKIRHSLLNWLKGRLLSMAILGTLWTGALYAIGIPGALFLGIFAALLAFVPYFGAVIAAVPPVLLALAGDSIDVLWVLLAYVAIQLIESYLLTPLIEGRTTALHPAVVIAAVTLAGSAFGFLGVFLAVPATVVAKVLIEEIWFRRLEEASRAPTISSARDKRTGASGSP